jgi:hypothetical protein
MHKDEYGDLLLVETILKGINCTNPNLTPQIRAEWMVEMCPMTAAMIGIQWDGKIRLGALKYIDQGR